MEKLREKHLDHSDKSMKSSALGALAGGLLGGAFGKNAEIAAIGAALGGLGMRPVMAEPFGQAYTKCRGKCL